MADDDNDVTGESSNGKRGKKHSARHRRRKRKTAASRASPVRPQVTRPYPRVTLEDALSVALALKEKNGGNPWSPDDLANAFGISKANNRFFYLAAGSRDFGLTEGGRDSKTIGLAQLGRDLVYAPDPETENRLKVQAFLNIEVFKRVLDYYKGSNLPEMKYLGNTLAKEFGLHPDTHEEFSQLFRENCQYLNIGSGIAAPSDQRIAGGRKPAGTPENKDGAPHQVVTLAEPEGDSDLELFVIMPFRERDPAHPVGFFDEVLKSLITPAGRNAGFKVRTANRQGSDVIQSTIINNLLNADLVLADLTEHNPNVLFELGLRMAHDKPVALIRAIGTGPIFDVDNMLRVYEYSPSLWATTVERDLPKLTAHISGTWDNRQSEHTYMKLLHRSAAPVPGLDNGRRSAAPAGV
jgi:hypothetical protein